jgi:hypothetical protein
MLDLEALDRAGLSGRAPDAATLDPDPADFYHAMRVPELADADVCPLSPVPLNSHCHAPAIQLPWRQYR